MNQIEPEEAIRRWGSLDPKKDYPSFLKCLILTTQRAVDSTGHEFHKGSLKAYKHALDLYEEFKQKEALSSPQLNTGNHE